MSSTARDDDVPADDPSPDRRPHLEVVPPSTATAIEPERREPNLGRSGLIGYIIGFVASVVGITIGGTLGGLGLGSSFGLGAFAGVWGGGGFGFMLGATIPLARHVDAQHPRRPEGSWS
jgi:hypothetical protein